MDEKELTALIEKKSEAGRKEVEEMMKQPLSAKELDEFIEMTRKSEERINRENQKIITERYYNYFHELECSENASIVKNGPDFVREYLHDFQIYQERICECLLLLLSGLSISRSSERMIRKILLRHEDELRQMFNEQLPLPVAVKKWIYRFYHIEVLLCPKTLHKTKQHSMDEQDKKKIQATEKNSLSFRIDGQFSYSGHHDRVKILVNRVDIIQAAAHWIDDNLGLPPEKMLQTDLWKPGKCLIGMCRCGDEECDPYYVDISINDDTVVWDDPQAKCRYQFDKTEYGLAIKKLQKMLTAYVSNTPYKPTKEDLEEYKKAVYEWLTEKMEVSEEVAKSRMKNYENFFEEYLEDNWSACTAATAILHNF